MKVAVRLIVPLSTDGIVSVPFIVYLYEVAPSAPVQDIENELSFTRFELTIAAVGRGGKVVTFIGAELVGPVEPSAVTIRTYVVLAVKPVKDAVSFSTSSDAGVVAVPSKVYV